MLANKSKPSVATSVKGADEILNYKEFLDQGIITDEEAIIRYIDGSVECFF
ncbi:TPA: hypothetical protein QCX74_004634 [Bacillus mycoides]|nr:hypothetical protein [Bacillus mycoides]